jgi:capsid portal protein
MAFLTKLTLVAAQRSEVRSPAELRRAKLLLKLAEQLDAAEALIGNRVYTATREVRVTDEAGNMTRVTRQKRLRSWFWHNTSGKWFFEVRYGARVLELGKGKRAVEVGTRDQLPAAIKLIQEAIGAGELDSQIEAAAGLRKLKMAKA